MEDSPQTKTGERRRQIVKNKKYAPATGIQSDFEKVLTSFVETKSVRYEDFAKIWREKKLSLICAGRQSDREAVEFMEECMKVAFKMFLPPYGFQARVGALYLLYGLYLTQPCLPKVKIRVTRTDWEHVKSLQEEFIRQNHHDTNFILHKLLLDGAFFFCAISQEPRGRYAQTEDNKSMSEALREDRQRIDDLFADETMEQLDMIHRRYHQQKVRVAGPDASRPDRSLDVLHDKFPDSVKEQLQQHHEQWKIKETSRQGNRNQSLPTISEGGESDDVESDLDCQPTSSVGQRRARLKAMAYRGAKNKQRYKHRSLTTEASSSEEKGSPSPKKKRGRPRGAKSNSPIQRAPMATISEQEEESAAAMETSTLLHMPNFEEVPSEEKRPGRKRKARADTQSSTAPKQKKSTDGAKNTSSTEADEMLEASIFPVKRGRGRPPKPRAGSSVQSHKVGRPAAGKGQVDQPTKSKKKDSEDREERDAGNEGPEETVKENKDGEEREEETTSVVLRDNDQADQPPSTSLQETTSSEPTLSQPSPSTSQQAAPAKPQEPSTAESPAQGEEPASAKCEASGRTKAQQSKNVKTQASKGTEGRKRSGDASGEDDGREGAKVRRKSGGEGKAARLKVTPLQVVIPGKGKKKP